MLDNLCKAAEGDRASVRDAVGALGRASFVPVLMLPALIVVSPLSGIPGLPTVCGVAIGVIALQMLVGRAHLWLPQWLLNRTVPGHRLTGAIGWLRRPAAWVDGITARRMQALVQPPVDRLLFLACALAGLAMPALELLPFTSSLLAGAVVLMALGLFVHDGLVALAGLALVAGAVALVLLLVF